MAYAASRRLIEPFLPPEDLDLVLSVIRAHPEVTHVKLFGSRAKGTHQPYSDVDLAVWGEIDALGAQRVVTDLEELPLPYHFDVVAYDTITLPELREHIDRVGLPVYP